MTNTSTNTRDSAFFDIPGTPDALLAQMARMYKYDLSEFEALMWATQVFDVYPDQQVMRALLAHMEQGDAQSNFMPKFGQIKARLEPTVSFAMIQEAVKRAGPYRVPAINDPVVLAAIEAMGGWAQVCAQMPDPVVKPMEFDRYVKRFETAILAARNKVQVLGYAPAPLRPLLPGSVGSTAPALGMPASTLALGMNVPSSPPCDPEKEGSCQRARPQ